MKSNNRGFAVKATVLAVEAALLALSALSAARAADGDDAVRELTQPTNIVNVGVGYVTQDSFKFGQYNGLFDKGPYAIFDVDWRGGGTYDSDSAVRWRLFGTNLGLDTRSAGIDYGEQGKFRIFLGYDELRSNYSDTFQTPYLGWGTNTVRLPANWVKPVVPQVSATAGNFRGLSPTTGLAPALTNGVLTPPNPGQLNTVGTILANDVPAFQDANLDTIRKTASGGFSYDIDPNWRVTVSASTMDQTGLKPLNMISLASGTFSATIPNLIDQTTNQYNAAVAYTGEKLYGQLTYYGSYFNNHVQSMTFENGFVPGTFATMSTAPSNEFNQFSLKGGYNFTPTTKLVVGASYARNTQNQAYLNDPTDLPVGTPVSSLDGLVVSTQAFARLSAKPMKDLNVNVGYRYDDRDNKTPINIYQFYDAGEPKTGTTPFNQQLIALGLNPAGTSLGSNINIYANRPYSKTSNTFNADASYRLAPGQSVKGDYEWSQIDRSCPGSWINCADATKATTNTLRAAWDGNMLETLSGRLSYAYSQRRVDYDPNAWLSLVPMAQYIPANGATTSVAAFLASTGLGGFGPNAPWVPTQPGNLGIFFPNNSALPQVNYGSRNDIHELPGMERYNMADRNQNKVRATLDWGATDKLSLQGNVEYNQDDYNNSVYGLQNAKSLAINLEGAYQVSENFNASLFYTYEEQKAQSAGASYSAGQITNAANVGGVAGNTVVQGGCFATVLDKNVNAKIDPCLNWATNMVDKVNTFGANFTYRGLMGGRLDLLGNFLYSQAKTNVGVTGGTYANNPFAVAGKPAVSPAVFFIPAANLPEVTTTMWEFQIGGQYAIDKHSGVRLTYWYQQMRNTDYAYDGMQYGTITSVMPTNQQAWRYNVSVIGLSYVYSWQ